MKAKKILAGILAAATAALNLSVPIKADEDTAGQIPLQIDGFLSYDPDLEDYRDENGDPYIPCNHEIGIYNDYETTVEYPEKYDTRDLFKDYNIEFPEIKNQNPTGSCWAHAALAASEINGILKGVVDPSNCNFSEAHLNYFAYVSDKNTNSEIYGDYYKGFTEPSVYNDYYSIYNAGGNQDIAISVLSRGTGPAFELPQWDIGPVQDYSYVILDRSTNYPVIFDTVTSDRFYFNGQNWCYKKDGTEIVLNGSPYSLEPNVKNNLYFNPIDEKYRYNREYTLLNAEKYTYDYDVSDLSSINNIKEAILKNGSITVSYYADIEDSMLSSKYGYYFPIKAYSASVNSNITEATPKAYLNTNHAITIIGWDDTYKPENFYCDNDTYSFYRYENINGTLQLIETTYTAEELRPKSKGAWLCRNSWGSSFGDGGYFYISYEEPELKNIYSYDISSEQKYKGKIYQNYGISSGSCKYFNNGYSAANIFTAESNDTITAVSFFTFDINSGYTVKIYKNVTDGSPMSGTLAASKTDIAANSGYHTVELDSPVSLTAGEKFSVILSTNDTVCFIDTYNKGTGNSFIASTETPSSSAYFSDTYSLKDDFSPNSFNVCIKALTSGTQTVKPEAPANLSAVPGDGQALLYWDPVENAEKYTIYYDEQKNGNYVSIASVTNAYRIMTTPTNGGVYRFAVTATVNGVESDYSVPVDAIPQAGASIINIPTGLAATAGDSRVSLTWNTVNGAKSYNVYYSTINNRYSSALYSSVTTNSCTVTGLTNDTKYYFWVSSCYVTGDESIYCDPVSATPVSSTGSKATNLKGVSGDGQVTLSWDCSDNVTCFVYYGTKNDASAATSYRITTAHTITITGLTNGTTYYFWVKAGSADYSEGIAVTPGAPQAPTGISAENTHDSYGNIKFTWNEVANASSYKFYYKSAASSEEATLLETVTDTEISVYGFPVNTEYYIYITAVVNNIESSLSEKFSIIIPTAPSGLTSESGNESADLSWSAVSGADKYAVYQCTKDGSTYTRIGYSDTNSCSITGLINGNTYYFMVAAVINGVESDFSDIVTAAPTAASDITITTQPRSCTLIGGTRALISIDISGSASSFTWQYNSGSGWKTLTSDSNVHISSGFTSSYFIIYNTAGYKNCQFRCIVTDENGNTVTTNTATLSFYDESSVTVSMVENLSSTNLTNYVNYFTSLYDDSFVLTAAQFKAIELVLAADYAD